MIKLNIFSMRINSYSQQVSMSRCRGVRKGEEKVETNLQETLMKHGTPLRNSCPPPPPGIIYMEALSPPSKSLDRQKFKPPISMSLMSLHSQSSYKMPHNILRLKKILQPGSQSIQGGKTGQETIYP